MTPFESIDRLGHRLETQFLDGATLAYLERPRRNRRPTGEQPAAIAGRLPELAPDAAARHQLTQAQKMEAIGRVTGGIAHNFNNLLTGILGFCDLLADRTTDRHNDGLYLENIMVSADRGGQLVRQLLAFSQQQILEPETFDLNRAVTDREPFLRQLAGDPVEVVIDLEPTAVPVRADPQQIDRVISHLAANAVEAMAVGGRLTLRTRQLELDGFSICHLGIPSGPYVLLEVEDTGTGIDEAIYDRIFEPFFSTKEELNRTGLGLSVVYGIIKQSGGLIRMESSPGHGTCFRIYLPRTASKAEVAPASTAISSVAAEDQSTDGHRTILLAEDDPTVQLVLKAFLAQRGYRVLAADDGAEGLEISERHDGVVDLLLTDIIMPRMDGLELAQKMLATRVETKVLFISGYAQERDALCELLGGNTEVGFLKKPFENEHLERKLRQMFDSVPPRTHAAA